MDLVLEQVRNGTFDPEKMFTGDRDKFLEVKTAIESISKNLTKETCAVFLATKILPTIFNRNTINPARDDAIEVGLHLLQFVNITDLADTQQENVLSAIEDRYLKIISELRDTGYPNWDKLWVLLIKLCHVKIHTNTSLANKLLREVEVAFRNSTSIEQRLKAYDCWKVLIDNCSLNMNHMCSAKQIKLLVTPMKAKFSRMPIVILKRLDTFVYLLEKLQQNATCCLNEFLTFCFGPFVEVERKLQVKGVPGVCEQATTILLHILGHSHSDNELCIKSTIELKLQNRLIHKGNFADFAEILINSAVESCLFLNEWKQEHTNTNSIVKCLWRSLLQLINTSDDDTKSKASTQINNIIKNLSQKIDNNTNIEVMLVNLVDLLIGDPLADNFREALFDLTLTLLNRFSVDSCPSMTANYGKFIISCLESCPNLIKTACDHFNNDQKCTNLPIMCDVWLKCQSDNLIWPIRNFGKFPELQILSGIWTKIYTQNYKSDIAKVALLQEIENLFLENPLLTTNIVHFIEIISKAEKNSSKEFVVKLMRLCEQVLTLPNLSTSDLKTLTEVILQYFDKKFENNEEIFDKLCKCLECIYTIHKDYSILPQLVTLLKNSQPEVIVKFGKLMTPSLETLILNEEIDVVNSARKIMELLEIKGNEPETISLTSTRSLRIVNMVNTTPKPTQSGKFRLFGKTVNNASAKPKKSNYKKEIFPLNDDKSSDYVKIDTEVKLDVEKMNEHQKEMLKKVRDDIPALYQDLTQSQSDTIPILNSESPNKENVKETNEEVNIVDTNDDNDNSKETTPEVKKRKRRTIGVELENSSKRIKTMLTRSSARKSEGNEPNPTYQLNDNSKKRKSKSKEIISNGIEETKESNINIDNSNYESMEELLARVDKRIEKNKRFETSFKIESAEIIKTPQESQKKKKKIKRSIGLSRSDYVSKRKKRSSHNKNNTNIPFHVTADCTIPVLNNSKNESTFKASLSPPNSDNITILITRNPTKIENGESQKKKKIRHKHHASPNSEDVIESSQAIAASVHINNNEKKRNSRSQRSRSQFVVKRRLSVGETPGEILEIKPAQRSRRCRSLDKVTSPMTDLEQLQQADTLTLPNQTKDDLSSSPITSETAESVSASPFANITDLLDKTKDDLPSSPITCETPDRTKEFLVNTLDISPINLNTTIDGGGGDNNNDKNSPPKSTSGNNDVEVNWRVARLLHLVNAKNIEPKFNWLHKRATNTPSPSRIRKLRLKKEENLDVLTFSREVPSPLSTPASGILKRKFSNVDEMATPSPKRKRVNFSDPAITQKKIIIKDVDEYEPINGSINESGKESEIPNDIMEDFNNLVIKSNSRGIGAHELGKVFLSNLDREEMISTIKDFCVSLKEMSTVAIQRLIENMEVPEIIEIFSEFLTKSENSEEIVEKCMIPLIKKPEIFQVFMPKVLEVVEGLTDEKLKNFMSEIVKIREKPLEDKVIDLSCDKMIDLIKVHSNSLSENNRNEFLANLLSFASGELPVNREFVNLQVNVLQSFVTRMTD